VGSRWSDWNEATLYVTRVVIDGVRGFSRSRTVDLDLSSEGAGPGWTVLAGRNASGKTTLLRAVVLALAGPRRSAQLLTESDRWISEGASQARVEIQILSNPQYDGFYEETRRESRRALWLGIQWDQSEDWRGDPTIEALPELKASPLLKRNASGMRKRASSVTWNEASKGFFYAAYGPFRRITGSGQETQGLMFASMPLSRVASLFRADISLAESVRWLRELHLRRLEGRRGAEELINGVLALLNDGLMPDDIRVERVDSEGLWTNQAGNFLPVQELSDGYRTVSSLVTDLVRNLVLTFPDSRLVIADGQPRVMHPGVVLIDEIEIHLHVSWQRQIGPWLTTHFPNIQFLVTTHSPYICQSAREGGLIRLPGIAEAGSPKPVDEQLYRRVVHGSGDDAVMSELFGIDSLYQETTRRMRRALTSLEANIALGRASQEDRREYERLRAELTSSPLSRVAELSEDEH
jgi:hypothetical protein